MFEKERRASTTSWKACVIRRKAQFVRVRIRPILADELLAFLLIFFEAILTFS